MSSDYMAFVSERGYKWFHLKDDERSTTTVTWSLCGLGWGADTTKSLRDGLHLCVNCAGRRRRWNL